MMFWCIIPEHTGQTVLCTKFPSTHKYGQICFAIPRDKRKVCINILLFTYPKADFPWLPDQLSYCQSSKKDLHIYACKTPVQQGFSFMLFLVPGSSFKASARSCKYKCKNTTTWKRWSQAASVVRLKDTTMIQSACQIPNGWKTFPSLPILTCPSAIIFWCT